MSVCLKQKNNKMIIQLKTLTHTNTIELEPYETVIDLKRKIYDLEGIPLNKQRIIFNYQQIDHKDTCSLAEFGLQQDSIVSVILKLTGITVIVKTPLGQNIPLHTYSYNTTTETKFLIQDHTKISFSKQRLFFMGKELEEGKLMKDYKIKEASVLHLTLRITPTLRIIVRNLTGAKTPFEADPKDTGYTCKKKLEKIGICSSKSYLLIFKGSIIKKDIVLSDYKIRTNSVIHLIPTVNKKFT